MKQAIAGVSPQEKAETTIMTVWPSIAATKQGQVIGRRCLSRQGFGPFFTWGKVWAILAIPPALGLFFLGLLPFACRRYRLTNRRVVIEKGLSGQEERSVPLDDFDSIEVVVQPGQEWYPAGDLVFRMGKLETFRLLGVSRPETFRQTCLKAQRAHVGVKQLLS